MNQQAPQRLPAATAAISVHGATKSYGDNAVLRGVDLTVRPGEIVAVIGPSGSGKSTLLRAIANLEQLDSGYVCIDGQLLGVRREGGRLRAVGDRQARRDRRRIGFVFQNFNLFGNLTAVQNVVAAPRATGRLARADARETGLRLLDRVGLADWADHYPRQLSGGQQQRVAIARALAPEPSVLLLDEPTSALDPELVGEVLSVIRDCAADDVTMVLVTHEIAFAREVADRIVFFDQGQVVESGPPELVIDEPQKARTRQFIGAVLGAGTPSDPS
ncbi:amino acid ABC transporter ATP-binding protein [Flexivirga oryzae]|uniref:Polar amino acid transport system ATP-binding protein n=1 Tax=Flexivirga oryzae TaxID=1794944 RepID=A0A839N3C8_9MICO|nr:amino acid ABC transporter ATP-binding protein [Flexivirga oryzae]MBB2892240.1 polar amino acid transport system ATP-binding protein [Flexivirga oryzae]